MVDFRSRYDPTANNQALIRVMAAKAGTQSPISAGLQQVIPGIEKGLQMSEAIGKIKEDRQRKQRLAELLSGEQGTKIQEATGGMAEFMKPEDMGKVYAEIKAKEASAGIDDEWRKEQTEKSRINNDLTRIINAIINKPGDLTPQEQLILDRYNKTKVMDTIMRNFSEGGSLPDIPTNTPPKTKIPGLKIIK